MESQLNMNVTTSPHIAVRPEWLALLEEEIIDPDLQIVDPHHHLWDHLGNRYFVHDILQDISSGHRITATVTVECGAMYNPFLAPERRPIGETQFLCGQAAMADSGNYGECRVSAGIVGHADLRLGSEVASVLQAHTQAGGGRFKGVRYSSVWHPDPSARGSLANPPPYLLANPNFRKGFAQLAPLGLSFDAWMYHTQLPELLDLARAFPETKIALNHMGGFNGIGPYAGKRDDVFAEWKPKMKDLVACKNISIKIGGMGMRLFGFDLAARDTPPSSSQLAQLWKPYVETVIEMFGAKRCMFESNFPVDKGSFSYAVAWNAFKRLSHHATANEKNDLFHQTATRFYKL